MLGRLRGRQTLPLSGIGSNERPNISVYDWAKMFQPGAQVSYGGYRYQAYKTDANSPTAQYYNSNSIVFAALAARILLFSEARFQFQQMRDGRPGDLFGTSELEILETPWVGHTTRDLLAQVELDVAQAGNSYWIRPNSGNALVRLDPARVKVVTSALRDVEVTGQRIGEELLGYVYYPPGDDKAPPLQFAPEEVCHHKPYPDMNNRFVGTSWLTACLPDIATDDSITTHKQATIDNGASLSYVVSFDPETSREEFDYFVDSFKRGHESPENAGKTLFLGGGADVKTVGQTFENLALQATQAAGETRIAACSGVPPTILGFTEGLKGSSLNAGNYGQARRRLVDGTMRPLWGFFASAMASLINVPQAARLTYDDRDIAFLREDLTDQATIGQMHMSTILSGVNAGFIPDTVVEAVVTGDFTRLKHTGLFSVQLQPPSDGTMPDTDAQVWKAQQQAQQAQQQGQPPQLKALPGAQGK